MAPKVAEEGRGDAFERIEWPSGQLEKAQLGNRTTEHHTAVVWEVLGPLHVRILHQNWAGGREEGRKVGPGTYNFNTLKGGEVNFFRPIAPASK